jgi:hypothetical protein
MVDPAVPSMDDDDVANVDIMNKYFVGSNGTTISILMPPLTPLTKDDALVFAAWLVACADPMGDRFEKVMHKVLST